MDTSSRCIDWRAPPSQAVERLGKPGFAGIIMARPEQRRPKPRDLRVQGIGSGEAKILWSKIWIPQSAALPHSASDVARGLILGEAESAKHAASQSGLRCQP